MNFKLVTMHNSLEWIIEGIDIEQYPTFSDCISEIVDSLGAGSHQYAVCGDLGIVYSDIDSIVLVIPEGHAWYKLVEHCEEDAVVHGWLVSMVENADIWTEVAG